MNKNPKTPNDPPFHAHNSICRNDAIVQPSCKTAHQVLNKLKSEHNKTNPLPPYNHIIHS